MTSSTLQQKEWYEQLVNISRQAFDQAAFETAYHSLAAAMHCAKSLNDLPLLRDLLQEVTRQKRELNRTHPDHLMSSFSASIRGHASTYDSLERQISTLIRFQEAGRHLQKHKRQEEKD